MSGQYDFRATEALMDSMNQGIVYVDSERKIRMCNRKAKEITGIIINPHASHEEGNVEEGDIVIIADNMLGDDDGNTGLDELSLLNINDKSIQEGDMLVAVGVYKNSKIDPKYKYVRANDLNVPLKLDENYLGFHIKASIDNGAKEITIQVNEGIYRMKYHFSVGNMVIIDGATGSIKFFQAKGYSVRGEDSGNILRGHRWLKKNTEATDVDVVGKSFLDIFDESALSKRLFSMLEGDGEPVRNRLYEINKRPFICNMVPWEETDDGSKGVFLMIRDAENLESLITDRNEIIRQIEERETEAKKTDLVYPEDSFTGFTGKSPKAREVKYMAWKASKGRFNVIITGESGTGKSMLAKEIHNMGNPDAPFVDVNCNAIAPSLFESELFGYVGGAFTGARSEGKKGFFEASDGGTIFLDEIAEMNSNSVVFKSGLLRFEPEFESEIYEYLRIHNWKDILTNEQIEDTLISGEMEGLQKILNVKEPMYFERVRGIYEGLRGIRANINYKSEELMRGRIAEVSKGIYNTKIVLKPVSSSEDIINEMAEKIKQLEAMVSKAEGETPATEAVVDEPEVEPKETQKKPSKKSTPKKK